MSELLELLAGPLAFLLVPGRYRLVDSRSGSGGDASITLESASTRLQLVRDRTEVSLRFQPTAPSSEDWFWLGVARRLLDGDRPGRDELDGSAIEFLQNRLAELEEGLAVLGRAGLVDALQRARDERATELFG